MPAMSRMAPVWYPDSREIRISGYAAAGGVGRCAAQQRQGAARAIMQREMVPDPVLTVNRNRPCWVISTQHGAVCRRRTGRSPATICRRPSPGTPRLCRYRRCARWTQTADPGSWGGTRCRTGPGSGRRLGRPALSSVHARTRGAIGSSVASGSSSTSWRQGQPGRRSRRGGPVLAGLVSGVSDGPRRARARRLGQRGAKGYARSRVLR